METHTQNSGARCRDPYIRSRAKKVSGSTCHLRQSEPEHASRRCLSARLLTREEPRQPASRGTDTRVARCRWKGAFSLCSGATFISSGPAGQGDQGAPNRGSTSGKNLGRGWGPRWRWASPARGQHCRHEQEGHRQALSNKANNLGFMDTWILYLEIRETG